MMRQVHLPLAWMIIVWVMFGACAVTLSSNGYAFETGRVYSARYASPQYKNEDGNVLVFDNDLLDRLFGKDREAEKASNNVDRPSRDATPPKVPTWTDYPRVLPNRSLLAGISPNTNSRRAAALRFAEKGRTLIQERDYLKALSYLEKALDLDGSPFVYFYLARTHYYLGDYQGALSFVEVAESRLYQQPEWTEELAALRSVISAPPIKQTIAKQNIAWTYTEY